MFFVKAFCWVSCLVILNTCLCPVHVSLCTCAKGQCERNKTACEIGSLLFPCGFWGLNPCPQVWRQLSYCWVTFTTFFFFFFMHSVLFTFCLLVTFQGDCLRGRLPQVLFAVLCDVGCLFLRVRHWKDEKLLVEGCSHHASWAAF